MCLQLTLKFVDRFITVEVALIIAVVCLTLVASFALLEKHIKERKYFFRPYNFKNSNYAMGKQLLSLITFHDLLWWRQMEWWFYDICTRMKENTQFLQGHQFFFLFCIEKGYILQSVVGLLKRSQSYSSRKSHIWVLVNVIFFEISVGLLCKVEKIPSPPPHPPKNSSDWSASYLISI